MKKISDFTGKYMAAIVLAVAALALFAPRTCLWIQTSWINYLLMIVMFGMGLTLRLEDFVIVFRRPKDIITGCIAQFTVMPLLAFVLGKGFHLEAGLLAGVILVGTCPGGTASNVMTYLSNGDVPLSVGMYLSNGDVPLSVGMTSVNTLLSPFLTPAITFLLLKTTVRVDVASMFFSIIKVVIIPIVVGFIVNRFWGKYKEKISDALPFVSVAAITLIVAAVVSHNAGRILETGAIVFVVVILHNTLGYAVGFVLGKILNLPMKKKKALAIGIGMQNSGHATSLAGSAFSDLAMATVPGAIFSVWHNISGALLANVLRRLDQQK